MENIHANSFKHLFLVTTLAKDFKLFCFRRYFNLMDCVLQSIEKLEPLPNRVRQSLEAEL